VHYDNSQFLSRGPKRILYTWCWSWMKMEVRGLSMDENWPVGDNMVINPYMSVGWIPLHDITTIISVARKTFKSALFLNVLLFTRRPHQRRIMNLFRKLKLSCTCSNSTSLSHTPPLKHGKSETTLSPDLPSTRIIGSTIPFHKCFKLCSPMSDLMTRYRPQATMRFTCLVLVPFKHKPSKSECR
jgi:hypothetical protein